VSPRRKTLVAPLFAASLGVGACDAPQPARADFPTRTRELDAMVDSRSFVDVASDPARPARAPRTAIVTPPRPRLRGDERFDLEFRSTPLPEALALIADRAGVSFVHPTGLDGVISASLRQVTADQALEVVLDQGDLELKERSGVYSVSRRIEPAIATLVHRPSFADAAALQPHLVSIAGEGAVTVDAAGNLIHVSAAPDVVARVEEYLAAADAAAPREVLIEARILEVALDEGFEFGVSLEVDDISVGDTASELVSNFLRASDAFEVTTLDPGSEVTSVIRALQTFGRLHVIATPRVLALNQHEAKIEILEKIPYVDSTATTSGGATGVTTSTVQEVEFEEVGIRLHVTPVLGSTDEVTLKIRQEVSEVVDFFLDVPVTDTRLIDTRFVVRDRQTIVIGGLMKERTKQNEDGVPLLMQIPLLGWLFSGRDTTREKVELLVFITPRIVGAEDVSDIASEFKQELRAKSGEYRQDEYREFLDDVP
jgi:type II secretory pathway component GspD/PulD (secretin)